jgi:hypothetical protein
MTELPIATQLDRFLLESSVWSRRLALKPGLQTRDFFLRGSVATAADRELAEVAPKGCALC